MRRSLGLIPACSRKSYRGFCHSNVPRDQNLDLEGRRSSPPRPRPAQQQPHRPLIRRVRVCRCQHQRAQLIQVQP